MNATIKITLLISFLLLTSILLSACETPTKPERNNPFDESAGNYEGPFTIEERMAQIGIDLVSIPAGSFQMGSSSGTGQEQPVHTVELDAFEMSSTEITNWQYHILKKSNTDYSYNDYTEERRYSNKRKIILYLILSGKMLRGSVTD